MNINSLSRRLKNAEKQATKLDTKDFNLLIEIDGNGGYKELEYRGKPIKFNSEAELDAFIEREKIGFGRDISVIIDDIPNWDGE